MGDSPFRIISDVCRGAFHKKWGCYHSLFERSADYLTLLHLELCDDAVVELRRIAALRGWKGDTIHMLRDRGWRGHLVAATAHAVRGIKDPDVTAALWTCLERGTRVSPQVIVVLSLMDDGFGDHLRALFARGMMKPVPDAPAGPDQDAGRLGKIAKAVLGLHPDLRDDPSWSGFMALAQHDADDADGLSVAWKTRLTGHLRP